MIHEIIPLYKNRNDVTLTTYVHDEPFSLSSPIKRPAIIICPGGAYIVCAEKEGEPAALRFCSMGYNVFVLKYSVYSDDNCFPKRSDELCIKKDRIAPVQILEIASAFEIIHKNADNWHIDPGRIILCGFSAGAHNCAMYANSWNTPLITDHVSLDDASMLQPKACILGYPLLDYCYLKKDHPDAYKKMGLSNLALFGSTDPEERNLEAMSPVLHVNSSAPPTFIWATADDNMVPVQNSLRMAHALADNNIPFELHIFEHGSHAMSLATQGSASVLSETSPDVRKWTDLAEAWLEKRFTFIGS